MLFELRISLLCPAKEYSILTTEYKKDSGVESGS